jgi:hypothetical protein
MILLQLHEMFATRQLGEEIGRLKDMRRKSVVRVILSIKTDWVLNAPQPKPQCVDSSFC